MTFGSYGKGRNWRKNASASHPFRRILPRGYRCAININNFLRRQKIKTHSILALAIIVLCMATTANAKYSGGSGTEADPWQIADANDLLYLASHSADCNSYFILTADINLAGYSFTTAVIAPDANSDSNGFQGTEFTGSFDGNGHAISNLTIDTNGIGNAWLGLFGKTGSTSEIKNLGIEDVNITSGNGSGSLGGLVGWNGGKISNCYASGAVNGGDYSSYLGGLVGWNEGTISNCYSIAVVNGHFCLGGLVGENYRGTIDNCYTTVVVTGGIDSKHLGGLVGENSYGTIINCHASCTITGGPHSSYVGGLVGYNNSIDIISDCSATGVVTGGSNLGGLLGLNFYNTINKCYASVAISGGSCLGGLVGWNGHGTISKCYANGTVSGRDGSNYLGGLVGENLEGTINNCYATGAVSGGDYSSWIGGLVGLNGGSINGCYSSGAVATGGGTTQVTLGGLVGHNAGTISNCYASGAVTGGSNYIWIGGLVGFNGGIISNSYATGDVTGWSKTCVLGGLAGYNSVSISNCYATGKISGGDQLSYLGGLVGINNEGTINNCFWDTQTSEMAIGAGDNHEGTITNLLGKTTDEMQAQSTFTDYGWDFSTPVWRMVCECGNYPKLWWEEIKYGGGSGTTEDPYLICIAEQMNQIGADDNNLDKHFFLMNDIDLAVYDNNDYNIIGGSYSGGWYTMFQGVFDGDGHTIRNLKLNVNTSRVGLFGYIGHNGVVKNVFLEGIDIKAIHYAGGIAGRNEGTIENCHVSGTIQGQQVCGGITGFCFGQMWPNNISEIRNCSFRGQVTGTWATGGIVGGTDGPEIVKCYAIAEIVGQVQCGGIVGQNMGGNLNLCFSKGTVTCSDGAGGFAGITYDHCGYGGDIHDCYSDVTVNCSKGAGGFSGSAPGMFGQIWNCYCSGRVVYDANNYEDVGCFIGEYRPTPEGVFYSYFLETAGPDNGFGEPLSEEQMKQRTSFAGWDFVGEVIDGPNDIWKICEGTNYPKLAWQEPLAGDFVCPDGVNFVDYAFFAAHWLENDIDDVNGVDISGDEKVNQIDFALLGNYWMLNDCGACGGADLTGDGNVNWADIAKLCERWLWARYGDCGGAEITGDGKIDFDDLKILADNWLAGGNN